MEFTKIKNYNTWFIIATIWIGICALLSDFIDNPVNSFQGVCITLSYYFVVCLYSSLIIYLIGINKYVAIVMLPIYGIVGSAVAYYRVMYKITISPMIISCVFNTNMAEAQGVVSWQLVVWLLVNILLSILLLIWRCKISYNLKQNWRYLSVVLILLVAFSFPHRVKTGLNSRYPLNVITSVKKNFQYNQLADSEKLIPSSNSCGTYEELDVIFVIGESVRSDHLQINGYGRATNPFLSVRKNVCTLDNIYTPYGFTSQSLPYILTRSDKSNPSLHLSETSFAAIFREHGFRTIWIENQIMVETCRTMPNECDTAIYLNMSKSSFATVYDEDILPIINKQISKGFKKNLFIIHTAGSHWYYNNYVPQKHMYFQPITMDRVISQNTAEQIINSYDNTIRYLDLVLEQIIQRFENRNAVLIYLSDHGESLGENGNWLHQGTEETKYPACILWQSDEYIASFPEKYIALKTNKHKYYETDFLFHSILSVADIYVDDYKKDLDIFLVK